MLFLSLVLRLVDVKVRTTHLPIRRQWEHQTASSREQHRKTRASASVTSKYDNSSRVNLSSSWIARLASIWVHLLFLSLDLRLVNVKVETTQYCMPCFAHGARGCHLWLAQREGWTTQYYSMLRSWSSQSTIEITSTCRGNYAKSSHVAHGFPGLLGPFLFSRWSSINGDVTWWARFVGTVYIPVIVNLCS